MRLENKRITLFFIGAFFFGVYCFVFGQSGILERMRLENERNLLLMSIQYKEIENAKLAAKVGQYRKGDFREIESSNAGFIHAGDVRLIIKNGSASHAEWYKGKDTSTEGFFTLERLRIGWVVLSILILSAMIIFLYIMPFFDTIYPGNRGEE